MAKINVTPELISRIAIAAILMALVIFANFVTIRLIGRYAVEVYLYDKLSVAYDIGGMSGLKSELARIKTGEKLRRELKLAAEFEEKLGSLKEPKVFIDNALSGNRKKIMFLRNLRIISFALILAVLALRLFVNLKLARDKKRSG